MVRLSLQVCTITTTGSGQEAAFCRSAYSDQPYPSTINNEENILAKQASNSWSFINSELLLTVEAAALYGASDLRMNFFVNTAYPSGNFPNGMKRRRGPGNAQIGFTVPDLYLLRAETKARLDDLAGARTDLEALRAKRMPIADAPIPDAVATNKTELIRFILEERIREFAVTGYRWFDMRRFICGSRTSAIQLALPINCTTTRVRLPPPTH